ncbi:MAG: hypothetical protein F4X55_00660 [Candidatus Dadabacteria bacterium]|nr:hypothetical protein [Candidatus Dadabacteria bacterium]
MEILIPLLIALIILGIAVILDRRKKSRKQSDTPETLAKSDRSLSTPSRVEPPTPEKTVQQDGSVEDVRATPETPSLSEPKSELKPPYEATHLSEETSAKTNEGSLSTPSRAKPQTPASTVQENKSVEDTEVTPDTSSLSEPKTPYHTTQLSETPAKVSEPFNYSDSWKRISLEYKEQKAWQCEMCQLSFRQHKYYLHTHHIYGTRYDNLMALCIGCHSEQPGINHLLLKETSDYQGFIAHYGKKWRMSNISDFERIRDKFREYVKHESNILRYIDFGEGANSPYINYESGYRKENNLHGIWINAWIPHNRDQISAVISIRGDSRYFQSHYQKLAARKSKIEKAFSFEAITLSKVRGNIYQFRVEKENVDLTQIANLDPNFRWLRETLEKLYWVLRVHDTLG